MEQGGPEADPNTLRNLVIFTGDINRQEKFMY